VILGRVLGGRRQLIQAGIAVGDSALTTLINAVCCEGLG
jgi:hypothetical protein